MVESDGLENRYGSNPIEGSNPSFSATLVEDEIVLPMITLCSHRFFFIGHVCKMNHTQFMSIVHPSVALHCWYFLATLCKSIHEYIKTSILHSHILFD